MEDIFYKLLIIRSSGIGATKFQNIMEQFNSPANAAESLMVNQNLVDSVRREMDMAAKMGICFICADDPRYPSELKQCERYPPIISVRGNVDTLLKRKISIVGTRHASGTGIKFTSELAHGLAQNNVAIVSGMAIGTDTAAHHGALRADGNTQTIAVLAGGVDYIWPTENERLYYEIIERGCVIGDMPLGMKPNRGLFVARNAIVAGICDTLILGEADSKSGSMSTARFAHNFGKNIYAVPSHPADARASGPNEMIRNGNAKLCLGLQDFFQNKPQSSKKKKNNDDADDLLDKIGIIPMSESVLSELVKKNISEIKSELVILELQGKIRKVDGGYVRL